MAIYSCSIKSISRSNKGGGGGGRSIVASVAYADGEKLTNLWTGEVYDYTRKQGVESSAIYLPDNAPEWAMEREKLWNAAEQAEKRKNSCLGRQVIVAIPHELSKPQRTELVGNMARFIAQRYNVAVDAAIHAPSRQGDERNFHAHILFSSRRINAEGFGEKTRELDDKRTSRGEVQYLREMWSTEANKALERANVQERIDHRSLRAQGIKRMPGVHLGPTATAMERRNVRSRRGDMERAVKAVNAQAAAIEREIGQLEHFQAELKQKALNEQKIQKEIEKTRKWAEGMREPFALAATVAVQLTGGDAKALLEQARGAVPRQKQAFLEGMQLVDLIDENFKVINPDPLGEYKYLQDTVASFCLIKKEYEKEISFHEFLSYEMQHTVNKYSNTIIQKKLESDSNKEEHNEYEKRKMAAYNELFMHQMKDKWKESEEKAKRQESIYIESQKEYRSLVYDEQGMTRILNEMQERHSKDLKDTYSSFVDRINNSDSSWKDADKFLIERGFDRINEGKVYDYPLKEEENERKSFGEVKKIEEKINEFTEYVQKAGFIFRFLHKKEIIDVKLELEKELKATQEKHKEDSKILSERRECRRLVELRRALFRASPECKLLGEREKERKAEEKMRLAPYTEKLEKERQRKKEIERSQGWSR
jgi:hypothetical protein